MADEPILTKGMMETRIAFTNQYRHWKVVDWKKVMFSHEAQFELNTFRRQICRRHVGSEICC
jgi:hypothetical protein